MKRPEISRGTNRCVGLRQKHQFWKGSVCLLCGAVNPKQDPERRTLKGRPRRAASFALSSSLDAAKKQKNCATRSTRRPHVG